MKLHRVGAALGNWNDERIGYTFPRPRSWRVLDRLASWLYVRGSD